MKAALLCTEGLSFAVSRTATAAWSLLWCRWGFWCTADSLPGVLWRYVCVCVRVCARTCSVQGASVTMCLKKNSFIKQLYNKFLEVLIYNSCILSN